MAEVNLRSRIRVKVSAAFFSSCISWIAALITSSVKRENDELKEKMNSSDLEFYSTIC